MSWDQADFLARLQAAVGTLDREGAAKLCNELIKNVELGEELEPRIAKKVLGELRRKCYFDLMERVAESLRLSSQSSAQIDRQYAQSLIDQGKVPVAIGVLEMLIAQTTDEGEKAEARGLLGRIYKQLYVTAVNADPAAVTRKLIQLNLQRAVDAYSAVYRSDPDGHLWHGINTVALLWRAFRDGAPTPEDSPDPRQLAREILGFIEKRKTEGRLENWDLATAAEACVALARHKEALEWIRLYVEDESKADAFELSSTLRQLKEVWRLTPDAEPGASLLPPLQAAALDRQGGGIDLGPGELGATIQNAKNLERNFGNEGFVFLPWYIQGLERCKAVAQVRTETGDGFGTGFLIRGGDIAPALGDEVLLLTNAHVVSNDPEVRKKHGSLLPEEAVIVFEAQGATAVEYKATKLLWTSAPEDLDATLLRLDQAVQGSLPCPLAAALPLLNAQPPQKIYIIGHPRGGKLTFSLYDNHLLDYDQRLIHYRTPTEKGSSGSPVFNQQWKLVALHHSGDKETAKLNGQPGTYAANEGILIQKISEAVKAAGIV